MERAAPGHERGRVAVRADAEQHEVEDRGRTRRQLCRERFGVRRRDALGVSQNDRRRMDGGGRHASRDEEGVTRDPDVAPRVVGRHAALIAPEPRDTVPGHVAPNRQRHEDTPSAPPARERDRRPRAARPEVRRNQRRRRRERLGIRRIHVDLHARPS